MKKRIICIFITLCMIISTVFTNFYIITDAESSSNITSSEKKQINKLLATTETWAGNKLLSNKKYKNIKLNSYDKIVIAGYNSKYKEKGITYYLDKKNFEETHKNIFNKLPNYKIIPNSHQDYNSYVYYQNGKLCILIGEWGLGYPYCKSIKVTKLSKNLYSAKCIYYYFEEMTKEDLKIGSITYKIKKTTNTKYGYIITGALINTTN